MAVANLFSRGKLVEFGGASYFDLALERPKNAVGHEIDTEVERTRILINDAELAANTGNPIQAVTILSALELPEGSHERELYLSAAEKAQNWQAIIITTDPPTTINELVQRFEAFFRLGDFGSAIGALDQFSQQLSLLKSVESELRHRASSQEAIKR